MAVIFNHDNQYLWPDFGDLVLKGLRGRINQGRLGKSNLQLFILLKDKIKMLSKCLLAAYLSDLCADYSYVQHSIVKHKSRLNVTEHAVLYTLT